MRSVRTFTMEVHFLKCPKCNAKYESIGPTKGVWRCYKCGYDFGEPPFPGMWVLEKVRGVRCDSCRTKVSLTPMNFLIGFKTPIAACPHCQKILAVFYRGKWRHPESFMEYRGREGIIPAKTARDRITAFFLNEEAMREVMSFRMAVGYLNIKIMWHGGRAVGYYTYSHRFGKIEKPCMQQIYVRPEYRRRGFATAMVRDFLESFEGREVLIESPNEKVLRLLEKLGLVRTEGDEYVSTGRIYFVRGL